RDTQVEVTPTTDLLVGPGATTIAARQTTTFTLHAYDTLQLAAATGDVSGTQIKSDLPIGVYDDHEATNIPEPFPFRNPCCADRLEEQLYPTTTWGKVYAIARGRERANQIHDYVRVVAQRPNTVVQFAPTSAIYTTCTGVVLAAGQTCDAYLSADVEL